MTSQDAFAHGPAWHAGTLVGFDLETTGVDTTVDRVVTAAVAHVDPEGFVVRARTWLVDPGIAIPAAATAVHGVTTGQARTAGMPAEQAIRQIIAELEAAWRAGSPVVIFNAPYDLTLLDAEAARYRLPRLGSRPWWPDARVVDPLVIDRGVDSQRKGKRTLGATAEHYRAEAKDAHSALGDAVAAVAVARAMAREYTALAAVDARTVHGSQVAWHADWAVDLQAYLRSRGRTDAPVDRSWPLRVPVVGRHREPEPTGPGRHRAPEHDPARPDPVENLAPAPVGLRRAADPAA